MSIAEELVIEETANNRKAIVYRMVTDEHVCPYGLKTVDLLKRKGFEVEDNQLAIIAHDGDVIVRLLDRPCDHQARIAGQVHELATLAGFGQHR